MTGIIKESVRPSTFLVHDASKVSLVVSPWRGRSAGEAPDASEGGVLDGDYREGGVSNAVRTREYRSHTFSSTVRNQRVIVARVQHYADVFRGHVGGQIGEESNRTNECIGL